MSQHGTIYRMVYLIPPLCAYSLYFRTCFSAPFEDYPKIYENMQKAWRLQDSEKLPPLPTEHWHMRDISDYDDILCSQNEIEKF